MAASRMLPEVGLMPAPTRSWGWFAPVFLVGSLGVAVAAVGSNGARVGDWWGEPLVWVGLVTIFGSSAMRLLMPGASRGERIALVAFVGVALFLAKHVGNPLAFERYDELLHQRTLDDIVTTGRLFVENPLLPISPFYPGMEIFTAAIVQVSGVSYVTAGAIVLATSRLAIVLGLFLVYERISGSGRIAALGALIYMTHPNFVFFNGAYAYESFAIPIGVGLIFIVLRQGSAPLPTLVYGAAVAVLSLGVTASHHVTALAMSAFLSLWAAATFLPWIRRRRRDDHVVLATVIFLVVLLVWSLEISGLVVDYLGPVVGNAISGLYGLIVGSEDPRELFVSRGGIEQPLLSRVLGLAAPVLLTASLPVGFFAIWRRLRSSASTIDALPALVLAIVAAAYPASLAFRLTSSGAAQASGRSAEFLFLGVGFVAAMAAAAVWQRWELRTPAAVFGAALCAAIFVGGVIVGTPEWSRVPRPYTPGADARSIEEHGLALADWTGRFLDGDSRVAADRMTRALVGAYGGQYIVSQSSVGVPVWPLFFSTEIPGRPLEIIQEADVEYIVIDTRLVGARPHTVYIESGEQFRIQEGPMRPAAIRKWEDSEASRIYDNGAIYIYDLRLLHDAP